MNQMEQPLDAKVILNTGKLDIICSLKEVELANTKPSKSCARKNVEIKPLTGRVIIR